MAGTSLFGAALARARAVAASSGGEPSRRMASAPSCSKARVADVAATGKHTGSPNRKTYSRHNKYGGEEGG
jgi:hypothetical protein